MIFEVSIIWLDHRVDWIECSSINCQCWCQSIIQFCLTSQKIVFHHWVTRHETAAHNSVLLHWHGIKDVALVDNGAAGRVRLMSHNTHCHTVLCSPLFLSLQIWHFNCNWIGHTTKYFSDSNIFARWRWRGQSQHCFLVLIKDDPLSISAPT